MQGMTSDKQLETESKIPERPFGSKFHNDRLSESVSIVGLGCSSFSTFFWNGDENNDGRQTNENESKLDDWSVEGLNRYHPRVQTWIESIVYAIDVAGITLLDTAPWYGHGTSEIVLGWAFRTLSDHKESWRRNRLTINTKVGRYEADPALQFDFSRQATLQSVKRSLQRLSWDEVYSSKTYIDVLQLHDPEFSPTIQLLFEETIPAMLECQENGWCRALGMTGTCVSPNPFVRCMNLANLLSTISRFVFRISASSTTSNTRTIHGIVWSKYLGSIAHVWSF